MKPTKIYNFTVPAGGAFPLLVMGDYFKVQASTGMVEVRGDTFGTIGGVLPGQGLERTPFNRLEIRDLSGGNNLVQLLVADEAFVDDRITGEVSVIDGGRARTLANAAFLGTNGIAAGAAVSQCQLFNQAASTVRLVVKAYSASVGVSAAVSMGLTAALLTGAGQTLPVSKLAGGAVGANRVIRVATAGVAAIANPMEYFLLQASSTVTRVLQEPIVLLPGYGMQIETGGAPTQLNASFEWVEESLLS